MGDDRAPSHRPGHQPRGLMLITPRDDMVQTWDGLTPQTRETDAHTFQFLLFVQSSVKSQPMAPSHKAQESGPVHLTVGVTQLFLPTLQTPWLSSMLSRSSFRGGHSHPTFLLLWEPPKRRGKGWGRERPSNSLSRETTKFGCLDLRTKVKSL